MARSDVATPGHRHWSRATSSFGARNPRWTASCCISKWIRDSFPATGRTGCCPHINIAFQYSILISTGLLDLLFRMTGLILFLVCPSPITIRRCFGDQSAAVIRRPFMPARTLWRLGGFGAEDCISQATGGRVGRWEHIWRDERATSRIFFASKRWGM